jgi:hypothetical protein
MPIGNEETHQWKPIPSVMDWLMNCVIKPSDFVVDVGCGNCSFPRANVGVDRLDRPTLEHVWKEGGATPIAKTLQCDFERYPLPFKDKEVDFVFCRHVLEDLHYPFWLLSEMERVGKAGYIETPSPIAELTRGVDGYADGVFWRGYYHHHYFIWVHDGVLTFISKFPVIEHFSYNEEALEDGLRKGPELWNTYYLWNDEIKVFHFEEPFDYTIDKYQELLWNAAKESDKSTQTFVGMVNGHVVQAA